MTKCCSQSRCGQIDCAVCARRYAGRLAKRIQNTATGKLFVFEAGLPSPSLADFWNFRVEARNFIDYRRRYCAWWREFLFHGWFCRGGIVRGIGGFGSLTPAEVSEAFQKRWPMTLRAVSPDSLRLQIVSIIGPGSLIPAVMSGRYQAVKFAVWPRRVKVRAMPISGSTKFIVEPMPILI